MQSPRTSDSELEWLRQLEDYVQEVLRSRASRDVNALQEERTTLDSMQPTPLAAKAGSWTFMPSFTRGTRFARKAHRRSPGTPAPWDRDPFVVVLTWCCPGLAAIHGATSESQLCRRLATGLQPRATTGDRQPRSCSAPDAKGEEIKSVSRVFH